MPKGDQQVFTSSSDPPWIGDLAVEGQHELRVAARGELVAPADTPVRVEDHVPVGDAFFDQGSGPVPPSASGAC